MQKLVEKLGLSEGATSAVLWVGLSLLLLVVVGLLALWLVRTLRPSLNINGGARGGRPQRLAITDAFPLDREGRKLVIVRRDNTEHLLLIGGPNDLLVEGNITRHDRANRGLARGGESEGDEGVAMAPIQATLTAPAAPAPAPLAAPAPLPAAVRVDDFERVMASQRPLAPPPVVTPRPAPVAPPVVKAAPLAPPVVTAPPPEPAPTPAPPPAPPVLTLESLLPEAVPVVQPAPMPVEPAPLPVEPAAAAPTPEPPPPAPQPAPAPVAPPAPRPPAMSEMARRLNEALQKPMSGTLRPPFNRSITPAPPTPATPTAAPPAPPPAPAAAPAPVEPKLAAPEPPAPAPEPEPVAKADMDLLEEEMARLLGRPAAPKNTDTLKKPEAS